VSITETAAPVEEVRQSAPVSGVLPLAGIVLALIVNTAWIGFWGYCILSLI